MGAKLPVAGQCIRFLFIAWNIFVIVIGIAALGFGIWRLVDNNDDDYNQLIEDEYSSAPALSIVGAVITIVVAFVGIVGAIALWRPLLVIYAIIIAIFMIIQLVGAILAFVFRDAVADAVGDVARDNIEDYGRNGTRGENARDIIDSLQETFECCGWEGYQDWNDTIYFDDNEMFPESCECGSDGDGDCTKIIVSPQKNQTIYRDGCEDAFVEAFRRNTLGVAITGIVAALIQFFVIFIALALCVCIHRARAEYTTV